MRYDIDDTTHAPVVVVSVGGDVERETLVRLLDELMTMYRSWTEPGLVVFDFSEVTAFDATLRRVLAAWRAQNKAELEVQIGAVAYVITSRVVRGYLTAVNWLRPHALPQRVCSDRATAIQWLRDR